MYLIVKNDSRRIIGTASRPLSDEDCIAQDVTVFDLPDEEFSTEMLGGILEDYEEY